MLITPEYRDLNADLHQNIGYGAGGWRWVGPAAHFAGLTGSRTILDYGCGKATFEKWFPPHDFEVFSYDPVTHPDFDLDRYDFILCVDVLEHVEPKLLDGVLNDLFGRMIRGGLLLISTREASKVLADGRNAHLIVQPREWWKEVLSRYFDSVVDLSGEHPELVRGDEAAYFVRP